MAQLPFDKVPLSSEKKGNVRQKHDNFLNLGSPLSYFLKGEENVKV
jgi:hypothetical protein